MSHPRVWAPHARAVEIDLGTKRLAMVGCEDGWWEASGLTLEPGTDYAFRLDGGNPLPDPRSPWQPRGTAEASRTVDHSAFRWSDAGFSQVPLASAVMYELHVGTFTHEGTFDAVIGRLEHLVELGVTHVELMPVGSFPGARGWGYDGVALYAPYEVYGGPTGLKRLVDACHRRGLAVVVDVVYNHLGPADNYLAQYGPYFNDAHRTPWGDAINFDGAGSHEVRRFFIDNALMWLRDYHIDALRLDAVHAIFDMSAIHFLEELASEVAALEALVARNLLLVAESDLNDPRVVRGRSGGGFGLHAQWSDDFHHSIHALVTGERAGYYADFGRFADLSKALTQGYVYDGRFSRHRKSVHGRPALGLRGSSFVICAQNHDQIGNRARGERLTHLVSEGRAKIAAAVLLMAPSVPLLFQGQEWGATSPFQYFTDHDADLGRAVSRGRRREFAAFGWNPDEVPDPQAADTFLRSQLMWDELGVGRHAELLRFHRRLIAIRRSRPELVDDRLDRVVTSFDENAGWFLLSRGAVVLAFYLGDDRVVIRLDASVKELLLGSHTEIRVRDREVELPADSVAVLSVEGSRR
jgi:maltooligosyltrehalose trehalohydrolase